MHRQAGVEGVGWGPRGKGSGLICMQLALACNAYLNAPMGTITVRGLGADDLAALKQEAQRQGISMNRLALRRLMEQREPSSSTISSALEALAGTWSEEDADSFRAAIAPLEQVDPELWE